MPGNGPNTQMAAAYPTNEQYERWKGHADEMDFTVSGFIASMVEAGLKKFDSSTEPDRSNLELREQRDDLKAELDRKRERIANLEDQLYDSDARELVRFIEEHPGVSFERIIEHLRATVVERANSHLISLAGDRITESDGRYYVTDEASGERREVTYSDVRG